MCNEASSRPVRRLGVLFGLTLALSLGAALDAAAGFEEGLRAARRGDLNAAFTEFRRDAEAGHARAQAHLANMYLRGLGITKDYAQAAKWYRLAAEQGDATAQYNLGLMYYMGYGLGQDLELAAEWLEKAARQGTVVNAQIRLAQLYLEGRGVPEDHSRAYAWLDRAASSGNQRALKERRSLANEMTADEIKAAKALARTLY